MANNKQKLELTWIGKENRPRLEFEDSAERSGEVLSCGAPSAYKMHMTNWKIQIDPRQVHYLKFILEGYDNLATMSTVDRQQGIVELYIPSGNEDQVQELLASIKTEIGLKTEPLAKVL